MIYCRRIDLISAVLDSEEWFRGDYTTMVVRFKPEFFRCADVRSDSVAASGENVRELMSMEYPGVAFALQVDTTQLLTKL